MTGQYYQQPPPQQPYGQVPPEAESIKSIMNITGILALIFGILLIIVGIISLLWLVGIVPLIMGIVCLIVWNTCKTISSMVDQRQYEQAKSKTFLWMILGFIFGGVLPGILFLVAYLKFDPLINASRGQGYAQPPPQYAAPPPPQQQQRLCLGCGQQIPLNYNNCPHCGKVAAAQQQQQQSGTRMCLGCGQNIQANFNSCPHCGKQMGQ